MHVLIMYPRIQIASVENSNQTQARRLQPVSELSYLHNAFQLNVLAIYVSEIYPRNNHFNGVNAHGNARFP
jgi:hypothetical protein